MPAEDLLKAMFCDMVSEIVPEADHVKSMSRFMIPSSDLVDQSDVMSLFSDGLRSLRILYNGPRSLVFYGCRGFVYFDRLSS